MLNNAQKQFLKDNGFEGISCPEFKGDGTGVNLVENIQVLSELLDVKDKFFAEKFVNMPIDRQNEVLEVMYAHPEQDVSLAVNPSLSAAQFREHLDISLYNYNVEYGHLKDSGYPPVDKSFIIDPELSSEQLYLIKTATAENLPTECLVHVCYHAARPDQFMLETVDDLRINKIEVNQRLRDAGLSFSPEDRRKIDVLHFVGEESPKDQQLFDSILQNPQDINNLTTQILELNDTQSYALQHDIPLYKLQDYDQESQREITRGIVNYNVDPTPFITPDDSLARIRAINGIMLDNSGPECNPLNYSKEQLDAIEAIMAENPNRLKDPTMNPNFSVEEINFIDQQTKLWELDTRDGIPTGQRYNLVLNPLEEIKDQQSFKDFQNMSPEDRQTTLVVYKALNTNLRTKEKIANYSPDEISYISEMAKIDGFVQTEHIIHNEFFQENLSSKDLDVLSSTFLSDEEAENKFKEFQAMSPEDRQATIADLKALNSSIDTLQTEQAKTNSPYELYDSEMEAGQTKKTFGMKLHDKLVMTYNKVSDALEYYVGKTIDLTKSKIDSLKPSITTQDQLMQFGKDVAPAMGYPEPSNVDINHYRELYEKSQLEINDLKKEVSQIKENIAELKAESNSLAKSDLAHELPKDELQAKFNNIDQQYEKYSSEIDAVQHSTKAYAMKLGSDLIAFDSKDELKQYFDHEHPKIDLDLNADLLGVSYTYDRMSIADYAEAEADFANLEKPEVMDMETLQEQHIEQDQGMEH